MNSRQLRALIGLVAALVLAAAAFVLIDPLVGVGVLVLGVLAIIVVLQRTADLDAPSSPKPTKAAKAPKEPKAKAKADPVETAEPTGGFDDFTGGGTPLTTRQPTGPAPEPLQTWTPPEPLQAWSPNKSLDPGEAPAFDDNPWGTPTEADAIDELAQPWDATESWDDNSSWSGTTTESNPLDDLDRLDEVDVVAEVERLDSNGAASTLEVVDAYVAPINEEVESPDDIMAASEATELTVGASDNTELARLLAKVQQRLSAYE